MATDGLVFGVEHTPTALERRGDNLKGFKDSSLKVRGIIWPRLSYVCNIRSTSALERCSAAKRYDYTGNLVVNSYWKQSLFARSPTTQGLGQVSSSPKTKSMRESTWESLLGKHIRQETHQSRIYSWSYHNYFEMRISNSN